jgi:hypothetical protein
VRAMAPPGTLGFVAPATAAPLPDAFILRVAINGKTCLAPPADPATCKWLDSQTAIEASIPEWRIIETGMLVACPLVLFNGNLLGAP